eukprot:GFYU01004432.1.p1 GENE.GFYU01004432.1~~GFYU01004432.1.p1  ORF type:complete len:1201 (-),score=318.17 GFYU01004432.1:95-3412(-)
MLGLISFSSVVFSLDGFALIFWSFFQMQNIGKVAITGTSSVPPNVRGALRFGAALLMDFRSIRPQCSSLAIDVQTNFYLTLLILPLLALLPSSILYGTQMRYWRRLAKRMASKKQSVVVVSASVAKVIRKGLLNSRDRIDDGFDDRYDQAETAVIEEKDTILFGEDSPYLKALRESSEPGKIRSAEDIREEHEQRVKEENEARLAEEKRRRHEESERVLAGVGVANDDEDDDDELDPSSVKTHTYGEDDDEYEDDITRAKKIAQQRRRRLGGDTTDLSHSSGAGMTGGASTDLDMTATTSMTVSGSATEPSVERPTRGNPTKVKVIVTEEVVDLAEELAVHYSCGLKRVWSGVYVCIRRIVFVLIFDVMVCVQTPDGIRMLADMNVTCYEGAHVFTVTVATIAGLGLCIQHPVWLYYTATRHHSELNQRDHPKGKSFYLFVSAYREPRYLFALQDHFSAFLMPVSKLLFPNNTVNRSIFLVAYFAFVLTMVTRYKPGPSANANAMLTTNQIFTILTIAINIVAVDFPQTITYITGVAALISLLNIFFIARVFRARYRKVKATSKYLWHPAPLFISLQMFGETLRSAWYRLPRIIRRWYRRLMRRLRPRSEAYESEGSTTGVYTEDTEEDSDTPSDISIPDDFYQYYGDTQQQTADHMSSVSVGASLAAVRAASVFKSNLQKKRAAGGAGVAESPGPERRSQGAGVDHHWLSDEDLREENDIDLDVEARRVIAAIFELDPLEKDSTILLWNTVQRAQERLEQLRWRHMRGVVTLEQRLTDAESLVSELYDVYYAVLDTGKAQRSVHERLFRVQSQPGVAGGAQQEESRRSFEGDDTLTGLDETTEFTDTYDTDDDTEDDESSMGSLDDVIIPDYPTAGVNGVASLQQLYSWDDMDDDDRQEFARNIVRQENAAELMSQLPESQQFYVMQNMSMSMVDNYRDDDDDGDDDDDVGGIGSGVGTDTGSIPVTAMPQQSLGVPVAVSQEHPHSAQASDDSGAETASEATSLEGSGSDDYDDGNAPVIELRPTSHRSRYGSVDSDVLEQQLFDATATATDSMMDESVLEPESDVDDVDIEFGDDDNDDADIRGTTKRLKKMTLSLPGSPRS